MYKTFTKYTTTTTDSNYMYNPASSTASQIRPPLHHLQSLGDALHVLLGLEPERRYGGAPRVAADLGRGVRVRHGGISAGVRRHWRREVTGVAGLGVAEEAGQGGEQGRREPRVHRQAQAAAADPGQGRDGVVVAQAEAGGLHLLLAAPFCAAVLEPDLKQER